LVIGEHSHVVPLDKKDRDEYVQKHDLVAKKITPVQIVEAQKLERASKPKPVLRDGGRGS
jgi:hypothetical protein